MLPRRRQPVLSPCRRQFVAESRSRIAADAPHAILRRRYRFHSADISPRRRASADMMRCLPRHARRDAQRRYAPAPQMRERRPCCRTYATPIDYYALRFHAAFRRLRFIADASASLMPF